MATPEGPFSHSDYPDFGDAIYGFDKNALDVVLLDKLTFLKKSLETRRSVDFQSREFLFCDDDILESAALPASVQAIIDEGNELESLTVACAHAYDTDPTTVSYEFTFEFTNNSHETALRVLRPHYYTPTLHNFDRASIAELDNDDEDDEGASEYTSGSRGVETTKDFAPTTTEELSKLLASLVDEPSEDEPDPELLDYRRWEFPELLDALALTCDVATGKDTYVLTNGDQFAGEFSCHLHGNVAMKFQLLQTRFDVTPNEQRGAIDELEVNVSRFSDDYDEDDETSSLFRYRLTNKDYDMGRLDYSGVNLETLFTFIDTQIQQPN